MVADLFREINQSIIDESFHGGRNECFYYGITPDDAWKDWDIISAYTTVLAMLNPLFYSAAYESNAVNDYHYSTYGYAYLSFQFPIGVNYPCLPVRTKNGLVFPLAGETFATAPEIYLANSLGCKIEIQKGIIIPVDESGGHPFLPFVKHIQQKRNLPNQTVLGNMLWKQIGNSLYGKISQGSKNKRLYDPRIGNSKYIKPSKCSNLYFGAYTTGYLRALIAEIMNAIPADKDIISVTTDGFISNASDSQIKNACTGEIAQLFSGFRNKISGDSCILKEKYAVKSLLSWRTRGQATIKQMDGSDDIILAKSGIKTPYTDKFNQNKFIVDLFLHRSRKTTIKISFPKPLQLICKTGCDQTITTRSIRVNMDYDFKRTLCRPFGVEYSGKSILCFKTAPHKTIDNFNALSLHLHNYQISNYNFMTSVENLRNFTSYIKTSVAQESSGVIVRRIKRHGQSDLDVAMKTFFTAYARQAMGLERLVTYKSLANWLTDNNYACSESTIKNCAKAKITLPFNSVPKTKATIAFVEFVKSKFTNFEDTKFFS